MSTPDRKAMLDHDRRGLSIRRQGFYIRTQNGSLTHEDRQLEILKNYPADLIALARYMKVLSKNFLSKVSVPVINILPSFVGGRLYEMAYRCFRHRSTGPRTKVATAAPTRARYCSRRFASSHSFSIKKMKGSGANIERGS